MKRAKARYGEREFVEGPLPVRVEGRTLRIDGAPVLQRQGAKLAVTLGDETFRVRLCDFDRVRVTGSGALTFNGGGRVDVRAAGGRGRIDEGGRRRQTDAVARLRR